MFIDNIELVIYNKMETIGGRYIITKGIGTVIWSWNDYEEQLNKKKLNNVIYF